MEKVGKMTEKFESRYQIDAYIVFTTFSIYCWIVIKVELRRLKVGNPRNGTELLKRISNFQQSAEKALDLF